MTVSTEVSREEYFGNGVTTDFDYRFGIFTAENIYVEVVDPQGQIAMLALNADFTVTDAGSRAGRKIRLKKPLGNDWRISISRHLLITQETDLRNQGNFFPEVHEDVFDKLTMLIQQVFGKFGLELRRPSWLANYFDAKNQRIAHLAMPVDDADAASKAYVDNKPMNDLNGMLTVKGPIRLMDTDWGDTTFAELNYEELRPIWGQNQYNLSVKVGPTDSKNTLEFNHQGELSLSANNTSATFYSNGDIIEGPIWGGHISGWIIARANDALHASADFSVDGDNWWFKDNRRGLIFQGGYRDGQSGGAGRDPTF